MTPDRPRQGARPVSMDVARTGSLHPVADVVPVSPVSALALPAVSATSGAERVADARWPRGQRWVVSALDGGAGRTTVALGLAALLADQRPETATLLLGTDPSPFNGWAVRADARLAMRHVLDGVDQTGVAPALGLVPPNRRGVLAIAAAKPTVPPVLPQQLKRLGLPLLLAADQAVVDGQMGPVLELEPAMALEAVAGGPPLWHDPATIWVLVTDGTTDALRRVTSCLEWLSGIGFPTKQNMVVVINDRRLAPVAMSLRTALSTRAARIVQLPHDKTLATPMSGPLSAKATKALTSILTLAATAAPAGSHRIYPDRSQSTP